jgi:hypothetical protein
VSIEKKLLGTTPPASGDTPEGVSFDGTNDYLGRTSDLSGNADGKTFTFSCWVYISEDTADSSILYAKGGDYTLNVAFADGASRPSWPNIQLILRNSSSSIVLNVSSIKLAYNTWQHLVISCDLSNSSNRYVYVNDIQYSPTWSTYTNDNVDFTVANWEVGKRLTAYSTSRISHLFLDYTYRDLSVESNRRLFIDSDGKPVDGQDNIDKYLPTYLYNTGVDHNGFTFNNDGTKFFHVSNGKVYENSLSTAYDVTTSTNLNTTFYSVNTWESQPYAVRFNPAGTKMFVIGTSGRGMDEFSLSVGFDLTSTVSHVQFMSLTSQLGADGSGFEFNNNGTKLIATSLTNDTIYEYNLSSAYTLSSISYSNNSFSVASVETTPTGCTFNDDGSSIYIMGAQSGLRIHQFDLSVAYSLSGTVTHNNTYSTGLPTSIMHDISFNNDGTSLMFSKERYVHILDLGVAYDLSTASRNSEPVGSPASPIIYLPMTDAATAGSNSGTGGDFTVNGVLDTAGRAPNQFNCSASKFDGVNDRMSLSLTNSGVTALTFSVDFRIDPNNSYARVFQIDSSSAARTVSLTNGGDYLRLQLFMVSGLLYITIPSALIGGVPHNIMRRLTISVKDIDSTAVIKANMDGVDITSGITGSGGNSTLKTFVNAFVGGTSTGYSAGDIGELYFDTAYTDLATDNPFWDADANRPKPVRQVISETGTTPLIALPMRGDDAGNNLGSGGDFTVNSAPFTGARGGSEFWARSADFVSGSTARLHLQNISTTDTKTASIVIAIKKHSGNNNSVLNILGSPLYSQYKFQLLPDTSGGLTVYMNGTNFEYMYMTGGTSPQGIWDIFHISIDRSSKPDCYLIKNGVDSTGTSAGWTNEVISLNGADVALGYASGSAAGGADVGFLYLSQTYIDFSQESNRNLFVDQLGYPKDLTPAIDAGTIDDPLIYMKFDDTSAMGTNSGTGGDFWSYGTINAGADVDPNA